MDTPQRRAVRDLVYTTLADEGRAPSVAEIARLLKMDDAAVRDALAANAEQHALTLNRDGDAVRMAHPFSAAPMAFVVTPLDGEDERLWWGGCAWDSFGISAALKLDVRIDTHCPACGRALSYEAGPSLAPPADLAVRFERPASDWWDDVVRTCTNIRMFCSLDHAEQWTEAHAPGRGYVAGARAVWELAQPWYGDRLDEDFTPHTREHNQGLLEAAGLTGEFWELP